MKAALPRRTCNRCVAYEPAPAGHHPLGLAARARVADLLRGGGERVWPITPRLVAGVIVGTPGWTPPPHDVAVQAPQPPRQARRGVPVADVRGGHCDDQEQAERVGHDVPFAPGTFFPRHSHVRLSAPSRRPVPTARR